VPTIWEAVPPKALLLILTDEQVLVSHALSAID
jgi:hypothetical protein